MPRSGRFVARRFGKQRQIDAHEDKFQDGGLWLFYRKQVDRTPFSAFLEVLSTFEGYNDVVCIQDLMKMIGVGRNSAYKLLNSGEIPTRRLTANGKFLIDKESIIKYIRKQ